MRKVTVNESVFVRRPPDVVWDFTQDFARRHQWDPTVLRAVVLASEPVPRVQVHCAGGLTAVFQYRQFERPLRTSLAMEDVHSFLIVGGGGAWSYATKDDGTLWTQTNTLVVKPAWWCGLLVPLLRRQLRAATRQAMQRAKQRLEAGT